MAEFFATVLAKIAANLIESLIVRLAQALFTTLFKPTHLAPAAA